MPTNPVVSPLLLDLLGVFAFGLSGGLVAVRKRLDLFGVLVLAGATALGGGVLRDLLIGAIPPVGISDWRLIAAALTAGLVTFVYHPGVERLSRLVKVLDAVGLAVFAVGGALIALAMPGIPPLAAIIVGTLTAVGRRRPARRPGRPGSRGAAARAVRACRRCSARRSSSSPTRSGSSPRSSSGGPPRWCSASVWWRSCSTSTRRNRSDSGDPR